MPRRPRVQPVKPAGETQPAVSLVASKPPRTNIPVPLPIMKPIRGMGNIGNKVDRKKAKKLALLVALGILGLLAILLAIGFIWYNNALQAVSTSTTNYVKVDIEGGSSAIGKLLQKDGVIRSDKAFIIYTRLSGTQNELKAGTYRLTPGETTPEIVKHLTNGDIDTFSIEFLPGATLAQNRQVLINAGYSAAEVDAGLSASYSSPLFDTKPASSDLEGYIYGETYDFNSNATVGDILTRTFAQYESVIQENDLVAKFQSHGLTLYQGITLASIIQREAVKGSEAQIAQVFYLRLADNMPLGSDVTYQYIADKLGVPRDPNINSPYNTRINTGLPPGPISVPGLASLLAVADPAPGTYLYFLSGDDNQMYYAYTLSEHEANIAAHCQIKCSTN
jgi:UPF0755 protein